MAATKRLDELDLPEIDLTDPALSGERWHESMRELVATGEWLARSPLATVVLDREAGEFFLRNKSSIYPGIYLAELFSITEGPLHEQVVHNIINVNGADHGRLRRLLNPALSPRAADRYRPVMRGILATLWEDVEGDGRCDLVDALTRPYPARTIAAVMGAPAEDADRLHDWSMWIQRQFDPIALSDPSQLATINEKVAEFYAWVRPLIAARRQSPSDDLISKLITAEQEGDKLSEVELENLVLNVLVGGVDTSQSQLAHALRLPRRPSRAVGGAAGGSRDPRPARGRGGNPLRADHAIHWTHAERGRHLPRRHLPGRHGRGRLRVHGEPRPRGVRRSRGLRHHHRALLGPGPDLRRGDPLLRRRQPRPGRARRGADLPGREDRDPRADW